MWRSFFEKGVQKKRSIIFLIGVLLLIGTVVLAWEVSGLGKQCFCVEGACGEMSVIVGEAPVLVEMADTPRERREGLSGREFLAENTGMLFDFETEMVPRMWMKDMHFALDFIWIDANGYVVDITRDVPPETYPQTFSPAEPVRYVLEVPAGWAARHNIIRGDTTLIGGVMRSRLGCILER